MTQSERDTIVIPCAGRGSRLGLPISKELLPIGDTRVALDATLDLLAPHADRLRLVAVLGAEREATARFLRGRCNRDGLPLAVVFQDPLLAESTGAVLSAEAWFGPATAVLLPDQVLDAPAPAAIGTLLDAIHRGETAAFLTSAEEDPARLAVDGALRLEPDGGNLRVADFEDKPGLDRAADFNAVWFGYAFSRAAAADVLGALHRSTLREPLDRTELAPLLGAPAIDVGPFADLGTWDALRAHLVGGQR